MLSDEALLICEDGTWRKRFKTALSEVLIYKLMLLGYHSIPSMDHVSTKVIIPQHLMNKKLDAFGKN